MIFRITFLLLIFTISAFSQSKNQPVMPAKIEVPDLIQHLPDWENSKERAKYVTKAADLKKLINDQQVVDLIDFSGGTEAATADYEQGKLLIVEFSSPQFAVQADDKFKQFFAQNQTNAYYRKVGNYSVFLFGNSDETTASAFVDQIKYGKTVQWLGEDPYFFGRVERYYAETITGALVSSFLFIGVSLAATTLLGIFVGFLLYYRRKNKRLADGVFSDAGGMTRLNLDDLIE